MAKKRMFTIDVIDTDLFLEMPLSTQALYFHFGMRADDEGFVGSPKRIVRLIGASEDDLRLLVTKKYVIPFETGVIVIRHWNEHNTIKPDRKKNTRYLSEKQTLTIKNKCYLGYDEK